MLERNAPQNEAATPTARRKRIRWARIARTVAQSASPADPWADLALELARSRRFGHPFALLGMTLLIDRRSGFEDDLRTLRRFVRTVDRVWSVGLRTYVLLPEGDRATGLGLLTRIHEEAPAMLAPDFRLCAFPEDGLTGRALLAALERPELRPASPNGNGIPALKQDGLAGALSAARQQILAGRTELDALAPADGLTS